MLVADLLEGKEVVREGKKVAIISSGDAGVYGMAGHPMNQRTSS